MRNASWARYAVAGLLAAGLGCGGGGGDDDDDDAGPASSMRALRSSHWRRK